MVDWLLASDTLLFRVGGIVMLALVMTGTGLFALRTFHVLRRSWKQARARAKKNG